MGESNLVIALNKVLSCKHVFDFEWIHVPCELVFICRECNLEIKSAVLSYGYKTYSP